MRETLPLGVSLAPPIWSLSAEHSTAHLIEAARRRVVAEEVAALITEHPRYYDGDPVTASALALKRLAEAKGMETRLHVGLAGCALEGRVPGVRRGFMVSWSRGKAYTAVWIEPTVDYTLIDDQRPASVSKITRTALAGKRAAGVGTNHLAIVASPRGVTIGFAALTARVKAMA